MGKPLRALVIEDSEDDALLVLRELRRGGYDLVSKRVETPEAMDAALKEGTWDVVISDYIMPRFSAPAALKLLQEIGLDLPFIVVTGAVGEETAVGMMKAGAHDYVMKHNLGRLPSAVERELSQAEVRRERKRVEEALKRSEQCLKVAQKIGRIGHWEFDTATNRIEWSDQVYELYERDKTLGPPTVEEEAGYYPPEQAAQLKELSRLAIEKGQQSHCDLDATLPSGKSVNFTTWIHPVKDAAGCVTRLTGTIQDVTEHKRVEEQLLASQARLQQQLQGTLHVIQQMTETRDAYTSGHQKHVAELAVAIAREMRLPEDSCVPLIEMAALIHDIGKIAVPAEILSKPGKLSQAEFALIKTHPQAGYDMLRQAELPYPVPETVLQHHERYDGTGYPAGLSGDEILPEASILAVADVVEAMSSHRPYRAALGIDAALEEISAGSGTRFYTDVVESCLAVFRKGFAFSS